MKLVLILVLVIMGAGSCASSACSQEEKSKPDISLAENKRISPFPPKNATVTIENGRATVRWVRATTARVVGYEIYRSINGGPMKEVGRTKEPPFVDHPPPNSKVAYAVASIDSDDNKSRLRTAQPE